MLKYTDKSPAKSLRFANKMLILELVKPIIQKDDFSNTGKSRPRIELKNKESREKEIGFVEIR